MPTLATSAAETGAARTETKGKQSLRTKRAYRLVWRQPITRGSRQVSLSSAYVARTSQQRCAEYSRSSCLPHRSAPAAEHAPRGRLAVASAILTAGRSSALLRSLPRDCVCCLGRPPQRLQLACGAVPLAAERPVCAVRSTKHKNAPLPHRASPRPVSLNNAAYCMTLVCGVAVRLQ